MPLVALASAGAAFFAFNPRSTGRHYGSSGAPPAGSPSGNRRRGIAALAWAARLVAAGAFAALILVMAAAGVPRFLGYPTLVVTGGSMGEALPLGSLAFSRLVPASSIQPGDVMVYALKNGRRQAIAHRVENVVAEPGNRVFTTRGDANERPDPAPLVVPAEERVARIVGHVPLLGYVVAFVATPLGWALLVILPSALIGLDLLRSIWRDEGKGRGRHRWRLLWAG